MASSFGDWVRRSVPWEILLVILAAKLVYWIVGMAAVGQIGDLDDLILYWHRWDAISYGRIAAKGYLVGKYDAAWLPLYPILIRGAALLLGGSTMVAAWVVAQLASVVGLLVFYGVTRAEMGYLIARRALLLLLLFPTAFFFNASYPDGLLLGLLAGSLWLARRRRWGWAAGLLGWALVTRVVAVAAVPALWWEFGRQKWAGQVRWRTSWVVVWPLLAGWIYLSFAQAVFGTPFIYSQTLEAGWKKQLAGPHVGWELALVLSKVADPIKAAKLGWGEYVAAMLLVVVTGASWRVLPRFYWLYLAGYATFVLSTSSWASTPRYALLAFPLFWYLAWLFDRQRMLGLVWVSASCIVLVLLINEFVHGRWAF